MARALVVYESMFGNTEQVARAVAEGLGELLDVTVREVAEAPAPVPDDVDLIVAGGPTHAFSLSRRSTRQQAVAQGAGPAQVETGLREWLGRLDHHRHLTRLATFDTRVEKMRRLPGSAARRAVRIGNRHGYPSAGSASFYVEGTAGPLLPDEPGLARDWGRRLGLEVQERAGSGHRR